ncbi:hypothetical protein RE9431_49760 (plasmid) [Prescottella equi]|uniref:hypothetical protein n=1 Tax=Rhodococcus hoagii TaxID=43767 RepID=UPI001C7856EB|nr:hypothetical protein [Prescottella equi]BCN66521.1 hypothetical protein RE9431_49760 [Prescottella equi]
MAPITDYYGIPGPVPFLDVDIDVDNRMFVDPHAIRLHQAPEPFATLANDCTETFFREITRCALSSRPSDHRRGLELLQRFVEPWETRLGLATNSFSGHGGAEDVGAWIWNALNTDMEALLRVGVLRQIEDLPLFVEGIDRDITSDITTRIIFEPLAEFTSEMVDRYPQFRAAGHRIETFHRQVWDPQDREWTRKPLQLPVAGGKPLVLVPHNWARSTLLMSAGRYYETSVLTYAQLEQAVVSSAGKLLTTPKDILKAQPGLARGRTTNLTVTHRAHAKDEDLLAQFRSFVRARWTPPEGDRAA